MFRLSTILLVLFAAVFATYPRVVNADPIRYPGAQKTIPLGINGVGDVAGAFVATDGALHGFLRIKGEYRRFNFGPESSVAIDIADNGQVVGAFVTESGDLKGYLFDGRSHQVLERTTALSTLPLGLNNVGVVVGVYQDDSGETEGFILRRGQFANVIVQGALATVPAGINDSGVICGTAIVDGNLRGFLMRSGIATTFQVGKAPTVAIDIDETGRVVGSFLDESGVPRPFARDADGQITLLAEDAAYDAATAVHQSGLVLFSVLSNPIHASQLVRLH